MIFVVGRFTDTSMRHLLIISGSGHPSTDLSTHSLQSDAAVDGSRNNSSTSTGPETVSCQFAHLQCSFRSGCGSTLLSYNFECHNLVRAHVIKVNKMGGAKTPNMII